MPEKAPSLSFECPKLWKDMPGTEKERHCATCGHQVYNLSLMTAKERSDLLEKSRSERVCGLFFQDLKGNLVTAESSGDLDLKMRMLRLAAAAGSALALSACAKSDAEGIPLPGIIWTPDEAPK